MNSNDKKAIIHILKVFLYLGLLMIPVVVYLYYERQTYLRQKAQLMEIGYRTYGVVTDTWRGKGNSLEFDVDFHGKIISFSTGDLDEKFRKIFENDVIPVIIDTTNFKIGLVDWDEIP